MRNHLTTRHSLAAIVGLVASCVILGASAGCAQDPGPDANVSPVTRSSEASSVTADATGIQTFNVATETGALTISGHDLGGSPVAKFRVTKAPLVKHAGAVLPVIVVEETGADGSSMHAESASVYPNQTDLARTEFELYGVGNANLIVRSAFDASGTLARLSLFAYHGDSAPGETRLGKFLSSQIQSAKPFDVPSSYASIDDFIEAWVDTHGLAPVFDSKQLDRVYFTMKDPSWLAAVVDAIEPGTMASTDGNAATASDEGLTLQNQGGTGSGSSGSGSNGSGSKGSGSGSGGKSGSSGSGGSKGGSKQPGKVSGCDKGGLGGFLGGVLGNVAKNPIGAVSGAKACKKCADDLTGKSKKPVGTKTAARSTKPSGAKSALASSAKVVKTPKKTSTSSSACTTCQKFMKTTGVTKGATCLLGKVTNGLFGSSKGGASQNSKGNSPADDMSDECSSGGASCDAAPEGDSCTMGDDSCDFDPGQNANDSGSFDLGGDDGGDFDMFDADE